MITKQQVFDAFEGFFSKTGIKQIDGEWRLAGKYCYVCPVDNNKPDGLWDLWIVNTGDLSKSVE